MANRTKKTRKKVKRFLEVLIESAGNVSRAAEACGVTRSTPYVWRSEDPEFAQAWDEAVDLGTDALVEEVYRRAHVGTDEPVFYQGVECGTIRKYSDTLAIFLLKCHRKSIYGDTSKIEHKIDLSKLSDEEIQALEPVVAKLT